MINTYLDHLYNFIKVEYVLKNAGIEKQTLKEFYKTYSEYCKELTLKPHGYHEIPRLLRDQKINVKVSTGNKTYVDCDQDILLERYKKNGWLTEFDEFEDEDVKAKKDKKNQNKKDKLLSLKYLDEDTHSDSFVEEYDDTECFSSTLYEITPTPKKYLFVEDKPIEKIASLSQLKKKWKMINNSDVEEV